MEFIVREVLTKEDLLHYHRQVYQKSREHPPSGGSPSGECGLSFFW